MEEVEVESGLKENYTNRVRRAAKKYGASPVVDLELSDKLDQLNESQLIIITLLSRLYDVQMAALSYKHKTIADEIYDRHDQGGNFNPKMYVPNFVEAE